jgi:hypothetical protein
MDDPTSACEQQNTQAVAYDVAPELLDGELQS